MAMVTASRAPEVPILTSPILNSEISFAPSTKTRSANTLSPLDHRSDDRSTFGGGLCGWQAGYVRLHMVFSIDGLTNVPQQGPNHCGFGCTPTPT
jgi:hypothetical protein